MKFEAGLLAAAIMLAGLHACHATVRIAGDHGGLIDTYVERYERLRSSGETVIIDGLCASSCTIVLGAVTADKICVTSKAALGFHAAWDLSRKGRAITNPDATNFLYSMYPGPVRRWIATRGGLRAQLILLRGKALQALYKPCAPDSATDPRR